MITQRQLYNIGVRYNNVSERMMKRQYIMTVERVEKGDGYQDKARITIYSFETPKGRKKMFAQEVRIADAFRLSQTAATKFRVPKQGVTVDPSLIEDE